MQELTLNIKDFNFDSKIRFYYSLLYFSDNDLQNMKKYFGENLSCFDGKELVLPITEYYPLKSKLQRVKKIYDKINLSDEEILRLFHSNEIINCFKQFLKNHENEFDYNNLDEIESFYSYLILSKVEKHITYGTLWDFFSTCNYNEVQNAINSLDSKTKRELFKIFGDKGQEKTLFRVNQDAKNTILIKLYSHILLQRKPSDVISIIKSLDQDITFKQMKLMDYIRLIKHDSTLTDDQIIEIISNLDYQSRIFLREIYGDNYDRKGVVYNIKRFDSVIKKINRLMDNNSISVKNVKKERTRRISNETLEDFLKNNDVSREDFNKAFNMLNKNQQKIMKYYFGLEDENILTIEEISIKESKNYSAVYQVIKNAKKRVIDLITSGEINKPIKQKCSKKASKRKKETLEEFLTKNDINRESFDKALKLLSDFQRDCIEYYYGLKENKVALKLSEIALKLNKKIPNISNAICVGKKRILKLIKTGEINSSKKEKKDCIKKDNNKLKNRYNEFLKENNITKEQFIQACEFLTKNRKRLLYLHFGIEKNSTPMTNKEIALLFNKSEGTISQSIISAKKQVVEIIKSGKIKEYIINDKFKKMNAKLNSVYKHLLNDDEFKKLVAHTSPVGASALSLIANFDFNLDELAIALVMDKETVIQLLMSVSTIAIEYIKNPLYSGPIDFNDLNVKKDPEYIMKEGTNQEG